MAAVHVLQLPRRIRSQSVIKDHRVSFAAFSVSFRDGGRAAFLQSGPIAHTRTVGLCSRAVLYRLSSRDRLEARWVVPFVPIVWKRCNTLVVLFLLLEAGWKRCPTCAFGLAKATLKAQW